MSKHTFNAIKSLTNEELKEAHHENKNGLPKGSDSIIRRLQTKLYHENEKTIPLGSVQYRVSMEVIERFCELYVK